MKQATIIFSFIAAGVASAGGYGLYEAGMQKGTEMAALPSGPAQANIDAAGAGRKVLYWRDPMVPGTRFAKPGKSPFMDMQLVPVYVDDAEDRKGIGISPRMQQSLGIRTAEVTAGTLPSVVEAVGNVAYNERDVAVVQARSNGFVEKLYVRAPLARVKKGQPLAQLYMPQWVAAQEEYLSVKRMGNVLGADGLLDAARQRMRLAGMTDDQIRLITSSRSIRTRLTIAAPISGVVSELDAREGMTVASGAPLFRINGLDTVWINAEIPENVASQLHAGNAVEGRTPALPDKVFKGRIGAILPEVNTATRTLKARIELPNPASRLVPGMFVTINLYPAVRRKTLLVPSEAVIRTGKRSIVMVAQDGGKFLPVEVKTGTEAGDRTQILNGLHAGQRIVLSGQFLVDSEASLRGTITRMNGMPASGAGTDEKKPGQTGDAE